MRFVKYRFFVGLFLIIVCTGLAISSVLIQLFAFPQTLHLSPGQKMTLSAYYPLGFYAIDRRNFEPLRNQTLFSSSLILSAAESNRFDVEIRAFGRIPIRQVHVEIAEPPQVVPGGQAIGVLLSSRGVVVVGRVPVTGSDGLQHFPARDADIREGDLILAINGIPINRIDDIEMVLRNLKTGHVLYLTIQRQNQMIHLPITPIICGSGGMQQPRFKLGLYIEDPAAGVGTLTFFDPETRNFAGLGHHIAEFAGRKTIPFESGEIVMANISGIRTGSPGQPGEKIGFFNVNATPVGRIFQNSRFGIYGKLYPNFQCPDQKTIPLAYASQVKEGRATIYTVLKGSRIEAFQVEIVKVYKQDLPRDKGLIIQVTDPALLRETGGIIQGMSGSPIIQDGRFVGAITHVLVNDPTKGYGVLAEWMLDEMRKNKRHSKAS